MSLDQEALDIIRCSPKFSAPQIVRTLADHGYVTSVSAVQRARKKMAQPPFENLQQEVSAKTDAELIAALKLGTGPVLTKDQLFDKLQHEEAERQAYEALRVVEKTTSEFASKKAKELFDGEVKRAKRRLASLPTPVNGVSHSQPVVTQDVAATARDFAASLKKVPHFSPDKYQAAFESMTRDQQKSFLDAVVNEVGGSSDFKKGYATALEGSILILQRELARVKGSS